MLEEIQRVKIDWRFSWVDLGNLLRRIVLYIIASPFLLVGWVAGLVVGFVLFVIASLVVGYQRGLGVIKNAHSG